jgi:hypothetical protein
LTRELIGMISGPLLERALVPSEAWDHVWFPSNEIWMQIV